MRQYLLIEIEVSDEPGNLPSVTDWGAYKELLRRTRRWKTHGIKVQGLIELTQDGIQRRMSL